jgi:selenide,water dikinase
VLGKPLGVGVYSAALKKNRLDAGGYAQMIASTTRLNTPGSRLSELAGVHALTDVTGFGLHGHLLEVCRGGKLAAEIRLSDVPLLGQARALAEQGFLTGASSRNWAGYGHDVELGTASVVDQALLTDPQTSGGLLVACGAADVDAVLQVFRDEGFAEARVIGRLKAGAPRVFVRP